MFNIGSVQVPVIKNFNNLTQNDIENLKKIGIAYVKIYTDDDSFQKTYELLVDKALKFFRSSNNIKYSYSLATTDDMAERKGILNVGYYDRRSSHEQLESFRHIMGTEVLPPFAENDSSIDLLKAILVDDLAKKLIKRIFISFSLNEESNKKIDEMVDEYLKTTFSFTYYEKQFFLEKLKNRNRFNPHKDINLLTVLMLEKPGLQFWADGVWVDLLPRKGYAVVMLGFEAEILTNGQTRSSLHAVRIAENHERLSTVFFISLKKIIPFHSIDGNMLCSDMHLLDSKENYKKYNTYSGTERVIVLSSFNNCTKKINMAAFFMVNLFLAYFLYSKNKSLGDIEESFFKIIKYVVLLNVTSYLFLNLIEKIFQKTYFERMFMDYLQYTDCPEYASQSQRVAYQLGRSSFSLFGAINSSLDSSSYDHRSFWNAGFVKSFVGK